MIIRFSQITNSYLCYETSTSNLIFKYNDEQVIYDDTFSNYTGKWTFIAISNFYSAIDEMYKFFPGMINIYILNNEIPRESMTSVPPPGMNFDNIDLGNEIVALFGDMRFYNNFLIQPYGWVTSIPEMNSVDLILNKPLFGNTSTSCLTDQDVTGGDVSNLNFRCIPDYNPYLNIDLRCNDSSKYFQITDQDTSECKNCDSNCTLCSRNDILGCTCDFKNGKFWLRRNSVENVIYCDKPPYVDFALYNTVRSTDISISSKDEYTLEMWIYIYSYNEFNIGFVSHQVLWDLHLKIEFINESNKLKMKCYPAYDSALSDNSQESFIDQANLFYYSWNYVQCSTSLISSVYYANKSSEQKLSKSYPSLKKSAVKQTSLTIGPSSRENFGFIFIRELKLWSVYNLREFSTKCFVAYPKRLTSLLHYYPMINDNPIFTDYKTEKDLPMEISHNFIGYNIVDYENNKNIDKIKFTLDDCSYLTVTPDRGYFHITNFLFKCFSSSDVGEFQYKFYYSFSNSSTGSYFPISDFGTKNEMNFSFDTVDLNTQFYFINIYCDVKHKNDKIMTASDRIILYFDNNIDEFSYKESAVNLDLDKATYTDDELLSRSITIGSLASNYYQIISFSNRTHVAPTINRRSILIQDPTCTPQFCNERGKCILVDNYLNCLCDKGFYGINCQLNEENKLFVENKLQAAWKLITYNDIYTQFTGTISRNRIISLSWLISGAAKIVMNDDFYDKFFNLLFYVQEKLPADLNSNHDIWFKIYDDLLAYFNFKANSYKITNNNSKLENVRTSYLDAPQSVIIKKYMTYLKSSIESLAQNYMNKVINGNSVEIKSEIIEQYYSFDIYIKNLDIENFDFNEFFLKRHLNYEGYFDAIDCLKQKFPKTVTKSNIWMSFVYYKINPLVYDRNLYENSTSLLYTITFLDSEGKILDIKDCDDHPIKIYFPIYKYDEKIVQYVNNKKSFFYPNNTVPLNDDLFSRPVYVYPNGTVSSLTLDERIDLYHRVYNLTCKYLNSEGSFETTGVKFDNVTDDYFLTCKSSHLSTFMLFSERNIYDFLYDGPFFYFEYPQVFFCLDNFLNNYCSLLILCFVGMYILTLLTLIFSDYSLFKNESLLEFIKFQILKDHRRFVSDDKVYDELIEINRKTPEIIDRESFKKISSKKNVMTTSITTSTAQNKTRQGNFLRYDNNYFENNNIFKENKSSKKNLRELIALPELENEIEINDMKNPQDKKNKLTENSFKNRPEKEGQRLIKTKINDLPKEKRDMTNVNRKNSDMMKKNSVNIKDDSMYEYENVSAFSYLFFNIAYRHFYISPFTFTSSFNPRYKKFIILFTSISIMMIFNTICFTLNNTLNKKTLQPYDISILQLIIYGFIVSSASNIVIIPLIPLFRINKTTRKKLLEVLLSGKQLELLHSWETLRSHNRKISVIGIVFNIILMLFGFYIVFNFCSVMFPMQIYLIYGLCASILADCFALEFFFELICFLLYCLRNTPFR